MTTSCAAFCAMERSEEEDDTAAVDAADAERASSMMRKWDLPPRLLCVYQYSNRSAGKADGADVTYPQPSSKATPLLVVLEEQQLARLLCYTSSPEAILCKKLPYLNGNIGPRRGMCTREDLLSQTLQVGCWYNLRSRKALEDSKGHTTKSPLATNKTAAWRHA